MEYWLTSLAAAGMLAIATSSSAHAETLAVSCTNNVFTWVYYVDLQKRTVQTETGSVQYRVAADVSERKIQWRWSGTSYDLDRYSGILNVVAADPRADINPVWTCKTIQKRMIE
jgi:hypothetical protein